MNTTTLTFNSPVRLGTPLCSGVTVLMSTTVIAPVVEPRFRAYLFIPGGTTSGELLFSIPVGLALRFVAGMPGSRAETETSPASDTTVFLLGKNGIQFGSLTFAPGSYLGVFDSPADTDFGVNDILSLVAPPNADPLLSDVGATIVGYLL